MGNPQSYGIQVAKIVASWGSTLVTGFGPFEHHGSNFTRNPSGEVALALDGWCHDGGSVCIDGLKINVSDAGVQVVQNALLRGNPFDWEGIIHLGLESTTKGLKVEVAALNNRWVGESCRPRQTLRG